jgi:hypothetical protein
MKVRRMVLTSAALLALGKVCTGRFRQGLAEAVITVGSWN